MNFSEIDDRLTYYNAGVQIWEHLKERITRAQTLRNAQRDALTDTSSLRAYVEEFRKSVLDHMGGLPRTEGSPKVEYCSEIRQESLTVQNLILETRPSVRATASLYVPAGTTKMTPAILFLCGHSPEGRMFPRYQTVSRILASRGFLVLALDPTGQGERLNYYDPTSETLRIRAATGDHEYAGLQCLLQGHNISRYMLHDAMRAVDFLATHPLVDASRIGITGNSGGGTQTTLMMVLESRLAAAAPGTFVSSRRVIFDSGYAQDAEQVWPGFSEEGYDHLDLLMAFTPKPLCILGVEYDFFPIEGTRATVERARRFWELFGRGECLRSVEDRARHGYTDALGYAAADFFVEAFRFDPPKVKGNLPPLPDRDLWATKTGQILGDFPDSQTIFDENRKALSSNAPDPAKALDFLRKAVFKARQPADANLRITREFPLANFVAFSGFWWSQTGLINSGILLRDADTRSTLTPVTVALWEDGSRAILRHDSWIRSEIGSGRAVLVLNVTGMGPLEPHPFKLNGDPKIHYGTFFRINDDLITLGDSFAALRTYDVLRSLDALRQWEGLNAKDVRLFLHGSYGIYGALASLLEDRLKDVRWSEPMRPYKEILQSQYYNDWDIKSLILPGLVRWADWNEIRDSLIGGAH